MTTEQELIQWATAKDHALIALTDCWNRTPNQSQSYELIEVIRESEKHIKKLSPRKKFLGIF